MIVTHLRNTYTGTTRDLPACIYRYRPTGDGKVPVPYLVQYIFETLGTVRYLVPVPVVLSVRIITVPYTVTRLGNTVSW